jgi:DNA-directed RNA polymerase specialized sigma24 family protein
MSNKKHYISNKDILPELAKYKETGDISERLGDSILIIARNYSNKGSFSSYTWREDMVSEAVLTCLRYMHNFDPTKSETPNPFAYFTTICHNSFINYIRKQKKHSKIKDICYKNHSMLDEAGYYSIKGIDYQLLKQDE